MDRLVTLDAWAVLVSWPGGSWQNTARLVVVALLTYLVVLWALMAWWTYRDIRERTRDPFLQVFAVFLVVVFNLPGLWLYLITRPRETLAEAYARSLEEEALLQELEDVKACPSCRRRVGDDFIVCPVCQTQIKEPCLRCGRPLSYSWSACPYCAAPRRTPQIAAAARRTEVTDTVQVDEPTTRLPRARPSAPTVTATPALSATRIEPEPSESA